MKQGAIYSEREEVSRVAQGSVGEVCAGQRADGDMRGSKTKK